MKKYQGYTDGSGNNTGDKSGGWAFVLDFSGFRVESSGYEKDTTNNRMEIMGVMKLLEYLDSHFPDAAGNINITSDSQYVIKSITEWRFNWAKHGWKTSSGPVKNMDLWEKLNPLADKLKPEFTWIRGHTGHEQNERCDELAGFSRIQEKEIERRVRL